MPSEPLSTYLQTSLSFLQQNKLSALTILLLPLLRSVYLDYQAWYALGAGGLPHNPIGWLVQSVLRLRASSNVRDSSCYDKAIASSELERTGFLDGQLPAWTGNVPKTGKWAAPHRQLEQVASAEIKQALEAMLSQIAASNPQSLELGPSNLEGGAPALFISATNDRSNHTRCSRSPREVFHSHCEAEGSSHAVLAAADAKLVLDRGWGERHAVSGRALGFPVGYVMVFAPRSMREVETVGMIARAAARYGLEGAEVR